MHFDVLHSAGRDVFLGGGSFGVVLIKAFSVRVPLLAVVQRRCWKCGAKASEMTRASDTEKVEVECGSTNQV